MQIIPAAALPRARPASSAPPAAPAAAPPPRLVPAPRLALHALPPSLLPLPSRPDAAPPHKPTPPSLPRRHQPEPPQHRRRPLRPRRQRVHGARLGVPGRARRDPLHHPLQEHPADLLDAHRARYCSPGPPSAATQNLERIIERISLRRTQINDHVVEVLFIDVTSKVDGLTLPTGQFLQARFQPPHSSAPPARSPPLASQFGESQALTRWWCWVVAGCRPPAGEGVPLSHPRGAHHQRRHVAHGGPLRLHLERDGASPLPPPDTPH